MPSTLQKLAIDDELLIAIRLLKTGLRELNRRNGSSDFFHLPILLLSSGFERMMKTVICCHHLEKTGEFPKRNERYKIGGRQGHNLLDLLKQITEKCFSDKYLANVSAAKNDIEFLRDAKLIAIVSILSEFGQSARYYNLNVVLNEDNPGLSPDKEWSRLEIEVLKDDPFWLSRIQDPKQGAAIYREINRKLTIRCEMLARALSRLFTIGGLGSVAKQISPRTRPFLVLRDDQLGTIDYETVQI